MKEISAVQALAQLQHYSKVTEEANAELKSCFWQITKSKRKSHARGILTNLETSFSAYDLREEFNAIVGVQINEPALQDETDDKKDSSVSWRLVDARDEKQPLATTDSTGLRQRKQKSVDSTKKTTMKEEKEILDPLDLFGGLTGKEFRLAQQQATKALQHYIEAANAVAAILEQIGNGDEKR